MWLIIDLSTRGLLSLTSDEGEGTGRFRELLLLTLLLLPQTAARGMAVCPRGWMYLAPWVRTRSYCVLGSTSPVQVVADAPVTLTQVEVHPG